MSGTPGRPLPEADRPSPAHVGVPDTRGPVRFLWWLVRAQPRRVALGSFWGIAWMTGVLVPPYLLSRAVDEGLRAGDRDALLGWTGTFAGVLALTALASIMRHRTMTMVRAHASLHCTRTLARHAVQAGTPLARGSSSGDLSVVQSADVGRIGQILTLFGPGVGSVLGCVAVVVVLWGFAPVLALVVVLGLPVTALVLAPLLRRMHTRQNTYRDREGEVTTLAADIVSGLRVLCGIGGKERFARRYRERSGELVRDGYRLGSVTSWFEEVSQCAPLVFTAVVTWIAARLAVAGELTAGETVAVYGYVAALIVPVAFLVEAATDFSRGHVSLLRLLALLRVEPERHGGGEAPPPTGPGDLADPESGARVPTGALTVLVGTDPAAAALVADRLGGRVGSAVTWGGTALREVDPAVVRARILVSDNDAHLFAGTLREVVDVRGERSGVEVDLALRTAAAADVAEALPEGLDARVESQGRDLSGGQRQRIRLARAVLADPEVLILVEPTSAVDAHTEAAIAERLRTERRGGTTLVVTASPLVADRADRVLFLVGGRVAAEGTHAELVAERADYRALVLRGADEGGERTPQRPGTGTGGPGGGHAAGAVETAPHRERPAETAGRDIGQDEPGGTPTAGNAETAQSEWRTPQRPGTGTGGPGGRDGAAAAAGAGRGGRPPAGEHRRGGPGTVPGGDLPPGDRTAGGAGTGGQDGRGDGRRGDGAGTEERGGR
ncbi:ABC transporter transmembrane domain-containing protein [Nocardiopsis flavescens]|uniref:ABC transporter transmembrane domain-containing protein n=1 Tax=Nocardiopsis flavescens TaxID=758803 RepID=UPI0036475F09